MRPELVLMSLVALACTPQAGAPPSFPSAVILLDQSTSAGEAQARCAEAAARIDALMRSDRPFEVVILGTGNAATGSEPVTLMARRRWYGPSRSAFKKPDAKRVERLRWVNEAMHECIQNFRPSQSSPVFRGVERSLESLRARAIEHRSAKKQVELILFVHGDMSEGVHPALIAHAQKKTKRRLPNLPELDVRGIQLRICTGKHLNDKVDQRVIHGVWRKVFGEDIPFDVICARWKGQVK